MHHLRTSGRVAHTVKGRRSEHGSPIVDFDVAKPRRRRTLLAATAWTAVAASLVPAVLVFPRLLQRVGQEPDIVVAGSNRIAGGELARALSLRLTSEPASGRVQLGLSFLAKSGEYCRTFAVAQKGGHGRRARLPGAGVVADSCPRARQRFGRRARQLSAGSQRAFAAAAAGRGNAHGG